MRYQWIVPTLVAVCLAASPGWGQSPASEADKVRVQIEVLQKKLRDLDTSDKAKRRITELGSSSVPQGKQEPRLVVRVYDLSDLFSLAPPYPARSIGDFSGQATPLFPAPGPGWSGTGAAGTGAMMGGMGGMGMGGMGGMGGMPAKGGLMNIQSQVTKRQAEEAVNAQRQADRAASQQPAGAAAARTSIDELVDAIEQTISPDMWKDTGAGQGAIAILGNSLLISATEEMHEQIATLFDSFRQRWGTLRTISVQAHWLWLTEPEVAKLLAPDARPPAADAPRAFGLVDDAAWEALAGKTQKEREQQPAGYQAVVTCYNGQTVHVFSGSQKHFVASVIPFVGGNFQIATPQNAPALTAPAMRGLDGAALGSTGAVGYEPMVASIQEGAALQITPMATTRAKYVVLDIHSRVLQVQEKAATAARTPEVAPPMGSIIRDVAAAVERPVMVNHHLETTLRVPVDRRMLVGGMTFNSQPLVGEPSLYLFVKVAVQELRDDPAEGQPNVRTVPKSPPFRP
jgi:hypothetical protein